MSTQDEQPSIPGLRLHAVLMFIHDPPKSQTRKELKVNLPARQHKNLRALQSRTGLEAPVLVAEALSVYFSKLAEEAQKRTLA